MPTSCLPVSRLSHLASLPKCLADVSHRTLLYRDARHLWLPRKVTLLVLILDRRQGRALRCRDESGGQQETMSSPTVTSPAMRRHQAGFLRITGSKHTQHHCIAPLGERALCLGARGLPGRCRFVIGAWITINVHLSGTSHLDPTARVSAVTGG